MESNKQTVSVPNWGYNEPTRAENSEKTKERDDIKKIPFNLHWDRMPIDISPVFADEKPAGKHGFLKTSGENFVFEDGTKVRFWGTDVNAAANFPEHAQSEKIAKRLAAVGINLVRTHQLDAEWSCPNIFEYDRSIHKPDTRFFDPRSMEKFDYFLYCLKQEGIYIYLDFATYRRFKTGDGVENAHLLRTLGRPFCLFNRKMIELQKEYIKDLLEHVNPYTGLAYKDDPFIALCDAISETDIMQTAYLPLDKTEPYYSELQNAYKEETGDTEDADFSNPKRPARVTEFLFNIQKRYHDEMIAYIKSVGAKMPVTGTNWAVTKLMPMTLESADFTDAHEYFYLGSQHKFHQKSMMADDTVIPKRLTFHNVKGKPFLCGEWHMQWPNRYRAEAPVFVAAVGAFQNWGGFAMHTYRYNAEENPAETQKIGRNVVLGASMCRGALDMFNDPAMFGVFAHGALILRRGDVQPAKESVTRGFTKEYLLENFGYDYEIIGKTVTEKHKVYMAYDGKSEGDYMYSEPQVTSDTGELYRDKDKGYGCIRTGRTKAVYGSFTDMSIDLDGVEISCKNPYGTIAMSSLDGKDISSSGHILLTAIGNADNTGAEYSEDGNSLVKEGTAPILIDVIEAKIRMKTNKENLVVYAVDPEGFYTGAIETEYSDGYLSFAIGERHESMYYLILEY